MEGASEPSIRRQHSTWLRWIQVRHMHSSMPFEAFHQSGIQIRSFYDILPITCLVAHQVSNHFVQHSLLEALCDHASSGMGLCLAEMHMYFVKDRLAGSPRSFRIFGANRCETFSSDSLFLGNSRSCRLSAFHLCNTLCEGVSLRREANKSVLRGVRCTWSWQIGRHLICDRSREQERTCQIILQLKPDGVVLLSR